MLTFWTIIFDKYKVSINNLKEYDLFCKECEGNYNFINDFSINDLNENKDITLIIRNYIENNVVMYDNNETLVDSEDRLKKMKEDAWNNL